MTVSGDRKISQLDQATAAGANDVVPIVSEGTTKKITRSDLLKVMDTLASTSSTDPLSANQGAILFALIQSFIKRDTYDALFAIAAAAPTSMFIGFTTDTAQVMFYCGDATKGDNGFFIMAGG